MELPKFASLEKYFIFYDEVRGHKQTMLKALKYNPNAIMACDFPLQHDPDILSRGPPDFPRVWDMLFDNYTPEKIPFTALDDETRGKYEVAIPVVAENVRMLLYVPHTSPDYAAILLDSIKKNPEAINYLHPKYDDAMVIHKAQLFAASLSADIASQLIAKAHKNKTDSRDLYLVVARAHGWLYCNSDQELAIAALQGGAKMCELDSELYTNKEVMTIALNSGTSLKHVSAEHVQTIMSLFDHSEKIKLLSTHGLYLKYFTELQDDYEVVLSAIRNNGYAIKYASQKLKTNTAILVAAVTKSPKVYSLIAHHADTLTTQTAINLDGSNLQYIHRVHISKDLVMAAVRSCGDALQYAPMAGDADDEVLAAVQNDGLALQYASMRLRCDTSVVMAAVKQNPRALQYAGYVCRNNPHILLEAISVDESLLGYSEKYADNLYALLVTKKTNPDLDTSDILAKVPGVDELMFNVLLSLL